MMNKPYRTYDNVRIYGNNHNISLVYGWELTEKEAAEFDYLDNISEFTGFRYRGNVYSLDEFMRVEKNAPDWMKEFHGYHSDSFFSGILIKLDDTNESVKAYTYIS